MAHEIAKRTLASAGTLAERAEAVRTAVLSGMPLNEIEAYLDWLDAQPGRPAADADDEDSGNARTVGGYPTAS